MDIFAGLLLLFCDLSLKHFSCPGFAADELCLIPGILNLTYVENRGAAWNILSGRRWLFVILTIFILSFVFLLYIKERRIMNSLSRFIISFLFFGALGNLYDRVIYGYVRDMIHVLFVRFPIFNLADCGIVISGLLLIFDTLLSKKSLFDNLEHLFASMKRKKVV